MYTEFWLGLTNLVELTATGRWELEVVLTDYNGQTYTVLYSDFSVGDSSTNYRLSVSGFNSAQSTLWDSLNGNKGEGQNNGMAFSTRDRDHDTWDRSCSNDHFGSGGWWFNGCGYTALTGTNYNDVTHSGYNGILWGVGGRPAAAILPAGWKGSWPAAEMIIRKK